jgi:hypothetical protein
VANPADVDVFRGLVNGLAAEQIANDPDGRRYIERADHAVHVFLTGVVATSHHQAKTAKETKDGRHRTAPRTPDRP